MTEAVSMEGMERPNTVVSISAQLRALGLGTGGAILAHSSLSSMGWTCGGAEAVILGLIDAIGPTGTLVMPSHSGGLSDPALWRHPPVPESWIEDIRASMPAFRRDLTPTRGIGTVAEVFRKMDGVVRSAHPQLSFCAYGGEAESIAADHRLDYGMGENSPLARLYEKGARVLMLGTGYDSCTSLHLAEHRASWPGKRPLRQASPIMAASGREWVEFDEWDIDTEDFAECGADFEKETPAAVRKGRVGNATVRLVDMVRLVDYAAGWFSARRGSTM